MLNIKAASVEPDVVTSDGTVTIQPRACSGDTTASSAAQFGSAFLPFIVGKGIGSTALAAFLLAVAMPVANAQACMPAMEIEITVPYECPYNNFVDGKCMTPSQIADLAVQALFVDKNVEAANAILANDYIQHNPFVATGKAPVLEIIPFFDDVGLEIEVHRTIAEDNLVVYHSTYTNAGIFGLNASTLIGFDVFRVENGE